MAKLKEPAKKNGRPKKEIDFTMVEELCKIQCTGEEISAVLKVNYDTLNARIKEEYGLSFSDYYKRESAGGKTSLRRVQFKSALGGNVTMLIWLGKNYLGQKEPDKFIPDEIEEPLEFAKMTNKELDEYIDKHR